jgi:hypothetical protein
MRGAVRDWIARKSRGEPLTLAIVTRYAISGELIAREERAKGH